MLKLEPVCVSDISLLEVLQCMSCPGVHSACQQLSFSLLPDSARQQSSPCLLQLQWKCQGCQLLLYSCQHCVLFFMKHAGFTVSTCSQMQMTSRLMTSRLMFDSIPTNPRLFIKFCYLSKYYVQGIDLFDLLCLPPFL